MKIVLALHRYAPAQSGSEVYARGVAERLARDGHDVTVVATDRLPDGGRYRPLVETRDGVTVRRIPRRHWRATVGRIRPAGPPPLASPMAAAFAGVIAGLRPDVVIALPVPRASVVGGLVGARRAGAAAVVVPMYHFALDGFVDDERAWCDLLRGFDRVITLSDVERAFLIERGLAPDAVASPGMWVAAAALPTDDANADVAAWRARYDLGERFVVLTAAAEFSPAKGMATLAAAAARLPDVAFVFLGGTEKSRDWLRREADAPNVVFPGFVDAAEKAIAFRAADLFAMPSAAESFGIVYVEAQRAGTPVLAAETPAVREVVGPGGVFVPFGDADATVAAIARLRDDETERTTLAAAGRANAERFEAGPALDRIVAAMLRE